MENKYKLLDPLDVQYLQSRAKMYDYINSFFKRHKLTEVHTPILGEYVATSPHINPVKAALGKSMRYLHTSPEFAMKKLLANGSGSIYQLCKVFREKEVGAMHSIEFTMLEWYCIDFDYLTLSKQVAEFIKGYIGNLDVEVVSYASLFNQYLSINPFSTTIKELRNSVDIDTTDVLQDSFSYDDWLGLAFSQKIEPNLTGNTIYIVIDYPATQAEYSRIYCKDGDKCAMRFEVFVDGVELANGYDELLDPDEQLRRMESELAISGSDIPIDLDLIKAMHKGLPQCSGVALGIDRLFALAANLTQ